MSRAAAALEAAPEGTVDRTGLGARPRPQVNLLPPEVYSRRALSRVKGRLGLALLGILLLIGLGYAFAAFQANQAAVELADKQAEVTRLQVEQEQYAAVPLVRGQIQDAENALVYGTSTEVIWTDYILAIEAVAPAGWRIGQLTTMMPSPLESGLVTADPLATPGVGSVAFTGRATTLPDVGAWLDALNSIPGFSDARFVSAEITDDEGVSYFETTASVELDASVFALRFTDVEDQG